ncbi:PAS domain-containing protein [Actinoplanes sp. Pm04-4]|uniref:PAS domain-containing protein n=1 Tax=Paractinoplanes pyxinae TaxID=2997416 RepID=A0ABT4BDV9_9ACTN|nr:PAS domain-containing protein [Actinoplanes pyxinae]MCY1144177.1 PAS domain-containing protein [Actinoplanes pyxinae]
MPDGNARAVDISFLESILLHLPVAVSVFDRDLRYVLANSRAALLDGVAVAAHLGRHLVDVLPDLPASLPVAHREVIATCVPLLDLDVVTATPGRAHPRRFLGNYYPVFDGAAALPTGIVTMFDEVTDPASPAGLEELTAERAAPSAAARNFESGLRLRDVATSAVHGYRGGSPPRQTR